MLNSESIQENQQTEIVHEQTIYAEPLFNIGSLTVTNSLLNTWIVVFLVILAGLFLKNRIKLIPGKFQNLVEVVADLFLRTFDSVTNSREKSFKLFPFVFTFFILILLSNWMGLLPGVGTIGKVVAENGENIFVPFMRGGMADINSTLALSLLAVIASHILGLFSVGAWAHLNKFINIRAILAIPKKIKEDKSILIVNPIKVLVGFLEIVSEFAKVASLSFRLFGNIFAGEVLLAVMAGIFAFGLPLPFMLLEVIVGLIQAVIFSLLVLTYLSMMSADEEH